MGQNFAAREKKCIYLTFMLATFTFHWNEPMEKKSSNFEVHNLSLHLRNENFFSPSFCVSSFSNSRTLTPPPQKKKLHLNSKKSAYKTQHSSESTNGFVMHSGMGTSLHGYQYTYGIYLQGWVLEFPLFQMISMQNKTLVDILNSRPCLLYYVNCPLFQSVNLCKHFHKWNIPRKIILS